VGAGCSALTARLHAPAARRSILIRMADDTEVKGAMRKGGAETVKTTPTQFRAQIQQEIAQRKAADREGDQPSRLPATASRHH